MKLTVVCFLSLVYIYSWALNFEDNDVFEEVSLRIQWPSGIIITPVTDSVGRSYKMGIVQHNVIQIRPEWSGTNIIRGLFSEMELARVIDRADEYVRLHGWPTRRHVDYDVRPTNDLTLPTFLEESDWKYIVGQIELKLFPALAESYGLNASELSLSDLFLTKYESSKPDRNHLGGHKDKSPWSFVVGLNDNFDEGGTYFFDSQEVWRPTAGSVIYFNGARQHGGMPITSGNRYIIAGFCEYGSDNPVQTFEAFYDPVYDGFAYQSGFRSGDMIVGLQVCRRGESSMNVPDRSTVVGGSGEETQHQLSSVIKETIPILPDMSDEEWIQAAQSCERLAPGDDTLMIVKRQRKDRK